MSYYIRRFSPHPMQTLIPVQAWVVRSGVQVAPAGTNELNVIYSPAHPPLTIDLTDSRNSITQQDLLSFLMAVSRLPDHPNKTLVLSILARTQALVAVGVPDGFPPEFDEILDIITYSIATETPGLFQVDGDGFYDGDDLILKMS